MPLEMWELKQTLPNDTSQWDLKLMIPEKEVLTFINSFPGIIKSSDPIIERSYNYVLHLTDIKPDLFNLISNFLKEECPSGRVTNIINQISFISPFSILAGKFKSLFHKKKPAKDENAILKELAELTAQQELAIQSAKTSDKYNKTTLSVKTPINKNCFDVFLNQNKYIDEINELKHLLNNKVQPSKAIIIDSNNDKERSFLSSCIKSYLSEEYKTFKIFSLDPKTFIDGLTSTFKGYTFFDTKKSCMSADIFIFNDFHLLQMSDIVHTQFLSILQYRLAANKLILIITGQPISDTFKNESKLKSILNKISIIKFTGPDNPDDSAGYDAVQSEQEKSLPAKASLFEPLDDDQFLPFKDFDPYSMNTEVTENNNSSKTLTSFVKEYDINSKRPVETQPSSSDADKKLKLNSGGMVKTFDSGIKNNTYIEPVPQDTKKKPDTNL